MLDNQPNHFAALNDHSGMLTFLGDDQHLIRYYSERAGYTMLEVHYTLADRARVAAFATPPDFAPPQATNPVRKPHKRR